ncbi:DNA recombination protein RmuC [Georgenia satyanarayanai]|uniref:DNA recombination protein RmuC n=1 Tax=Georgenia satyanarayanai TaxID=860221 RepID=A0A2Y9A6S1_9MICO|nr:DNA recombination protein RmuC [Georgenia satyanarayanai]PYG00859.1 DNA recombination protein RmuC [Georgenia satyanarayanai]SSA39098.1 DNA recombination protein RmuC [Georgenia satyanarayanai]
MDTTTAILLAVATLATGLVLGLLLGRVRAEAATSRARQEAAAARARAEALAEECADLRERASRDHDVLRALAPVRATLAQVGEHVAELERERTEQYTVLAERLHAAQRSDAELRATTASLAGALRSGTTRGQWGEVQLRRVLEASGMLRHVDFLEQATVASLPGARAGAGAGRPDVVVRLPEEKYLVIDAKVPFDAYLEASAITAVDDPEAADRRARLLAAHARALRGHVDALASRRYHEQLAGSPELVVMFVPSEGLLSAALEADPALLEHALRQGVAPTSPSSLLALLRTTATIWSSASVTEDAKRLLELGRTLYERLGTVAGHVGQLGRTLESAVQHYNKVVGSVESRLLVTARGFEGLDAGGLEVREVDADRAQVRRFTASELTDPLAGELPEQLPLGR